MCDRKKQNLFSFLFRGVVQDGDISALSSRVTQLQSRVDYLRDKEEQLDRLCKAMKENYRQARKDPVNEYYSYVTRDDLLKAFGDNSVILTVRNCETIREGIRESDEDEGIKHTLRANGQWKSVDVRLVTTDGELTEQTPNEFIGETEAATETSVNIETTVKAVATNNNKRPGRRRRKDDNIQFKIDEESSVDNDESSSKRSRNEQTSDDEKELEERRITAQTLLGYRPLKRELKRNLYDDQASFDSKWMNTYLIFFFGSIYVHFQYFYCSYDRETE